MILSDLIRQTSFESPGQKALLNVVATATWMSGEIASSLAEHGVSHAQYNVLRILRGRHPSFYTCSEIAERLLDRTPDVTRLLVRLETAGLILRKRASSDRRVVEVEINDKGLALLASLDEPIRSTMARITKHLSDAELETLSDLLETIRTDQV